MARPDFHQNHATSFGEAGLAAAALAVDQFHQFFVQHAVAEQVGQSGDRLLDGADALHDLSALLQQLAQFVMRLPDDFLHVPDIVAIDRFERAIPFCPFSIRPPKVCDVCSLRIDVTRWHAFTVIQSSR